MSMPMERPMANNYVNRFFGGPPLSVIFRLILLSILIGVGGIDSGEAAVAKIRAGACLIELYSALVFQGLRLVAAIKSELSEALRRGGQARIDELVGADAAAMTAETWPT